MSRLGAQPQCDRIAIAGDLTTPWGSALLDAGYDSQRPSVWLLEGFLFYLETEVLNELLDQAIRLAAPGSYMGFDIVNRETLISPLTKNWVDMQAESGAPWKGTMDDPEAFLSAHGWKAYLTAPGAPDANHGRWQLPVIPVTMPNMPHLWFVTAEKL